MPDTRAPDCSSHSLSQAPLKPVWPVTSTRRPRTLGAALVRAVTRSATRFKHPPRPGCPEQIMVEILREPFRPVRLVGPHVQAVLFVVVTEQVRLLPKA